MAMEVELKYAVTAFDPVRERLREAGAHAEGRWFEENLVFDTPDRSLRARGVLLRLRRARDRALLTCKLPLGRDGADARADVPADVKMLDERQTEVAGFAAMHTILEGLGYEVALAYEKVRETWILDLPEAGQEESRAERVEILLDQLPFGLYVELEASSRERVLAAAGLLGLPGDEASTANYHVLHQQWRAEQGLPREDSFVFASAERRELLAELADPA